MHQNPLSHALLDDRVPRFGAALLYLFMALALAAFHLVTDRLALNVPLWGEAAVEIVLLLLPALCVVVFSEKTVPSRPVTFKRVLLVTGMSVSGFWFAGTVNIVWTLLWSAMTAGSAGSQTMVPMQQTVMGSPLWALILVIGIVPAVCEEFFFRGVMMKSYADNPTAAVLFAGAAFTLLHMDIAKFYGIFMISMFLGFVVLRGGNLVYSMIAHGINNTIAVCILKWAMTTMESFAQQGVTEEAIDEAMNASPAFAQEVAQSSALAFLLIFGVLLLSVGMFALFLILFLHDTKKEVEVLRIDALYSGHRRGIFAGILFLAVFAGIIWFTLGYLSPLGFFAW